MKEIESMFNERIISLSTLPKRTLSPFGIDKELTDEERSKVLDAALNSLPKLKVTASASEVLRMYFGLAPYDRNYTIDEIGHKYHLSRQRISEIKENGIRYLRHPSRIKELKAFLDD